jgi:diguanylate cyclase (GGDEF)-like protein
MPFEGLKEGKHTGMAAEYFAMFASSLTVLLQVKQVSTWSQSVAFLKQRECDVASLMMETPSRREYLNFTKPYLVTPMVVVTKLEELFISNIKELEGRRVGIVKGYAFKEILSQENPEIILQEVDSARAGMDMVLDGALDGFVGSLATAGYIIQREYIGQLKIAGKFNKNWSLGVGVRNDEPMLKAIFEKLIDQVPHAQRQEIQNRWQSIVYTVDTKEGVFKWVSTVSIVFIVIVLLVLFINGKLRREIKERKVAQQQLHKVSITDELTSLYNRRHFNTVISNLFAEAKYANESLSFAIMDLDYFKQYNDHYGHQAGDEVLRQIANVLQMSLYRSGDYCFRLGGEEFGILFKGESIQHAKQVFERMQNNIKALKITHEFGTKGDILTASFGVVFAKATLIPNTDMLYKLADDMLYKAKETGRDRVCIKEVL